MESEDMGAQSNKSGFCINFKKNLMYNYAEIFLVFSAVIVFGVLLATSALAQPGQMDLPSMGSAESGASFNQPPKLVSITPDKPSPQEAGTTIKWTANAIDPDGDAIHYLFRLRGPSTGGEWQRMTGWTESNNWNWSPSAADAGNNQIGVWIRDGKHADSENFDDQGSVDYQITQIPAPAPIQPEAAPEQGLVSPTNVPEQVAMPEQPAAPVETAPAPSNQPPAISSFSPDKSSPQEAGTSVTWTAQASDPENDQIFYRFILNGQPVTDWIPQRQWIWATTSADVGNNQVGVQVKDGKHSSDGDDSKTAEFTIVAPNQPPAISNLSPDKSSPQEAGATVTWAAEASDPENDPILYRFILNGQPVTDWTPQSQWTWTTTSADVGNNQVGVQVKDGKHNPDGDDSKTAGFTIVAANQPPAISSISADKSSPQETGAIVTWTAEASDPENDPILYRFFLNGLPVTDWTPQNQWIWTISNANVGDNQIEVQIRDGHHADQNGFDDSKSASFTVTAPNQKPVIINFDADKLSPQEAGSTITWTAEVMDAENDPILYRFFLNGQPATEWQSQNLWAWTTAGANVGDNQVEVRVIDGKHAGQDSFDDSKSAKFTITAPNQKPIIASFAADKTSPQLIGTVVTWTAVASDPENDPISYRFLLNGTPTTDWQPQNQWSWTATEAGTSQLQVQVRDGKHAGPESFDDEMNAEFTINAPAPQVVPAEVVPVKVNQPPSLSSLTPDKDSPQLIGTVVTWTAAASDPENDPISYRFLLNGTPTTDWQPQNQWSWTATEAGTSQIQVQVKDNQHAGPEGENGNMSGEFTINAPAPEVKPIEVVPAQVNQPPSLSGLTPDKDSPQLVGTTVTWTAAASDPENDPISYRFLLNGTPATDWQPQNQWSWTSTEAGTSQIQVQVKDNQHAGPEGENGNMSGEFTINAPAPQVVPAEVVPVKVNQPPSLSSLTPDKDSPQLVGTIVTWTAVASDPENDPISYRFLLNGTPATDWQPQNQWSWTATGAGTSQIQVQVKDNQHAGPEGENGNRSAEFIINVPAPAVVPVQENVTAPAANVTIPAPENVTVPVTPAPGNLTLPATENVTVPVAPENITRPAPQENVTAPVAPAPTAENQTPVLNALIPDKPTPQAPGVSITWTANATDADNDRILFRFFLNGPATAGSWQPETDWSYADTWTWTTSSLDTGENQVRVWARDGKHAAEDSFDSEQSANFALVEPARNISGAAFNDKNGNGLKDSGEGLASWTIQLVKPDGSEVSTLTDNDGSYLFGQLPPGSYTVREILPSGWTATSPTSGSYTVNLKSADETGKNFANKLTSFGISGMKFNDLNGNGANDGEPGMQGWTIQLSQGGSVVNTTTTGQDGSYKFENLAPGSYTIAEVEQSGWTRTAPKEGSHSIDLKDADVTGRDFGNHGSWAISGTKYNDLNGNGIKDTDEPGLAGWNIQLSKDGNVINATATGQDGSYAFSNLAPGTYTLSEVAQDGWTQTAPQGSYTVDLKDADVTARDFGNKGNLSISGVKFYDANGNGVQDSDEPGIPGQAVKLVQNGKEIATATSGQDGSYAFNNLAPGTYEVDDPITVSVTIKSVIVAPIPIIGSYSVSGVKFNDINGNGVKDPGEPGIANWGIDLVLAVPGHDLLLAQVQTDANGAYKFDHLFPGTYQIKELAKQGWTPTTPTELTVNIPGSSTNQNFGNRVVTPPGQASIWGIKFNDLNNNGANNGEPGLAGWTIQLRNSSTNTLVGTTITDASGWYNFTNLQPGGYVVSEVPQSGWTETAPVGGSYTFTLSAGQSRLGADFGNHNNNLPPVNPTLVPNRPSPQRAGTPIIWTAGASDPEGNLLQYRFFVRGPSPSPALRADTGYSANSVWTWSTVGYVPGNYQVEVWIRDGLHAGPNSYDVKKTVSFTLTSANLPPEVKVLFADRPAPQFAGSWVKWTALAFDPDGDPLQYRFFLRSPSTGGFWIDQTGWGRNNRWIWRTTPLDVGYSEVLVAVRDGHHASPAGADDYAVDDYFIVNLNRPPVITSLGTSAPSPQPVGATIRWAAMAVDPENNPVFYRYWLKGPSTRGLWKLVRDWSTDPIWTWPTSPADAGTSEVQVQVRDGLHASLAGWDDDAGALFTVLRPNLPPRLTALLPDKPSPTNAGTAVKWTAIAFDPDKDPIFYRFWLKGPSTGNAWKIVQDWSINNQWIWVNAPNDAGSYSVYVYARDGKHAPATGYDSAVGQTYALQNPPAERRLTTGSSAGATPSLAFTGDGYLMAYQSWELGLGGQGDVALQKFDPAWNKQKSVWVASSKANESAPALASAGGYYYVAYTSTETGSRNIFVKKYDSNLKLLDTRQLTDSPTDQDSPSLIAVGNNFYLAYQSWDSGADSGGDIFLTRYDQNWKPLATAQLTDQKSYQDRPSLAYAEGSFYVVYVSRETGNLEIFQKRLDGNLKVLETRRITSDRSDQDYPSLKWLNGQFMLLYASKKTGNYEIMLDRYLRDWTPIDSTVAVAALGDQTASSMAFSTVDGLYWVAYSSRDASGQNIYVKPLKLTSPSSLKPCDIVTAFSATKAGSPYTLTVKFYNNYGALADPVDLTFGWSPQDAVRQGDQLQRISTGSFQLKSVFGAKSDKSFRIGANIDGCISAKMVPVKVA